jgi:phosphoribosylformylglycinamidine cyclo-ligase
MGTWYVHPVFKFIQKKAQMDVDEMLRTFNCGIGLVMLVSPAVTPELLLQLKALEEEAFVIGRIEERHGQEPQVIMEGEALY